MGCLFALDDGRQIAKRNALWLLLFFSIGALFLWVPRVLPTRVNRFHKAIARDDLDTVKQMLARDPDLVQEKRDSVTPLHEAAAVCSSEMVEYLLKHGAEIEAKGGRHDSTALHWAAARGNVATTETLLAYGAAVDARDCFDKTPLITAASSGHVKVIEVLLGHGAHVEARDNLYGHTALYEAVDFVHVGAARILLEHGAKWDLAELIDKTRRDLRHIPLADRKTKDKYRSTIALLEEHKARNEAGD